MENKNEMVGSTKKEQMSMIDYTEFVKQLGREYGEANYEAVETPEDLQSTIDWADVNFYEGDSLSYMLEDVESEDIRKYFDDMEWEEYLGYEHIFVDAAKERMEECLMDWRCNLADDTVSEYEDKIAKESDEFFESVKCYGIESYDEIDGIEDIEIKHYLLERLKDALYNTRWLVGDMYDEIETIYNVSCVGPEDGFAAQLPILKFFGFTSDEYDSDNMSYCMDYMEEKFYEVWDMLNDVEYQIKNQVTVTA